MRGRAKPSKKAGHHISMSRGFLCALFGIAMTVFAWYGPWAWPAAPAFAVLDHVIGLDYAELPFAQKAAVLLLLIVVNVGAWGLAAFALSRLVLSVIPNPIPRSGRG